MPDPGPAPRPAVPGPGPRAGARTRAVADADDGLEAAARQAGVLAQASREVADTSREAAESLAELRTAIADISASTNRASAVAEEAARDAKAVDERIAALHDASEAITEIVRLISAISQQSRFLALNAYVEAARAGEVGRGFAVVADEVKQLAERTAHAASGIGAQIGAVQQETRHAVAAIQRIGGTLGSIAEAQDAIAAAVEQQRAATERVVENVDRAASGSERITAAVAEMAESQRLAYVRRALAQAQAMLADAGGLELADHRTTVTVRNQVTARTHTASLADLLVGGAPMERNADPRRPSPLVDAIVARVGGTCTLFQRLDSRGTDSPRTDSRGMDSHRTDSHRADRGTGGDDGMVRVATTVVTEDGRRNVGTYIPRIMPDGSRNAVLSAVLNGQAYLGPATVAGHEYFTGYAGVESAAGELIGMIYVGIPLDDMA